MKTSVKGRAMICGHEGCELKPYQDTGGFWTVGIGHRLLEGEPVPVSITESEANVIFHSDLTIHEHELNAWLEEEYVELTQRQFDACLDFHFNIGGPRFRSSGVARRLQAHNYDAAPRGFFDWTLSGGQRNRGLLKRRYNEARCYWWGIYP